MTYAYGTKGSPAVGKGLGGLPRREEAVEGEVVVAETNPYAPLGPNHAYFAGKSGTGMTRGGMYYSQNTPYVNEPWYYYPYPDNCETWIQPMATTDNGIKSNFVQRTNGGFNTAPGDSSVEAGKNYYFRGTDLRHCSYLHRNYSGSHTTLRGHIGPDQTFSIDKSSRFLKDNEGLSTAVDVDFKRLWALNEGGAINAVDSTYYWGELLMVTMAGDAEEERTFDQTLYRCTHDLPPCTFSAVVASENYITILWQNTHGTSGSDSLYADMYHRPAEGVGTGESSFSLTHYKTLKLRCEEMLRTDQQVITPDNMGRVWITSNASSYSFWAVFNPEQEYLSMVRRNGTVRGANVIATENHVFLSYTTNGSEKDLLIVEETTPGNFAAYKFWNSFSGLSPMPWGETGWTEDSTGWGEGVWRPCAVNKNGRHFAMYATNGNYYARKNNDSYVYDTEVYWINSDMLVDNENVREDNDYYRVIPSYIPSAKTYRSMITATHTVESGAFMGNTTLSFSEITAASGQAGGFNRSRVSTKGEEQLDWT